MNSDMEKLCFDFYKKSLFSGFVCFLFVAFFLISQVEGKDDQENLEASNSKVLSKSLTINIISNKNGVGLSQDIDILLAELTKLGHQPRFVADTDSNPPSKADINLFIQPLNIKFFPYAERNYLFPNAEWNFLSPQELAKFDMILCKTKEAERIFRPFNAHVIYANFTSKDCYNEKESKNFKSFFHLAGASIHKGTETLITTWLDNPNFPPLFVIRHKGNKSYPPATNLEIIHEYLAVDKLRSMQNQCGFHICPSETEGFGHYIMEAMSCGSVVVTTDAPPMNEFVLDKRCLIGYSQAYSWNLATNYSIDQLKLEQVVADLLNLPIQELEEIGRKNREFYLKKDQLFKQRLAEIFSLEFNQN